MDRSAKPLPSASLHIVLALLDGELHGYALMGRVAELSDGAVRMGPGTLYGTLNRLVEDGLIEETTARVRRDDNERRRYYTLTGTGRAVAVDELVRLQGLVHRIAAHLPGGATTTGDETGEPMHCMSRPTRLVAALLTLTVTACGDNGTDDADSAFCTAMEQVVARMAPDTASPAPSDDVRANFDEVDEILDQAEQNAPAAIARDVVAFASAIDDYVTALATVDYDLAAILSTPEGTQLAEDTSHALTPDMINHMTGPCGITVG